MKNFHPNENCPIRDVLCRLGDKWSMLVLVTLNANGTMRFSDINRSIADISQRMLTVTLRILETDGLINRKVYAEVPPRVEYQLTEMGKSLMPHIHNLVEWAEKCRPEIIQNRKKQTYPLSTNDKENIASAIASAHSPENYPHDEIMQEIERVDQAKSLLP